MLWEEYLNSNEFSVGNEVYIVDYRYNQGKLQRHVKPTLVSIRSNVELPKNKKIYYSDYHFKPISKTGKMLKKIISPYDNTGYRSYAGESVHVFLTKEEADTKYVEQIDLIKDYFYTEIDKLKNKINDFENLKNEFKKVQKE